MPSATSLSTTALAISVSSAIASSTAALSVSSAAWPVNARLCVHQHLHWNAGLGL